MSTQEDITSRRTQIAELCADPLQFRPTYEELAERFGCDERTITRDFQSAELAELISQAVPISAKIHGLPAAFANICKAIDSGDLKTSKWLIEQTGILARLEAAPTGDTNASATLLASILAPGDPALRAENERLKARLAAIEDRLSKLNGLGKEVLNDTTDCESK